MSNWSSNDYYYTVNDNRLNVTSGDARPGSWWSHHNYYVTVAPAGGEIFFRMTRRLFRGNTFTFHVNTQDHKPGAPIYFRLINDSGATKHFTEYYDPSTNQTTVSISVGATDSGTFNFVFDGNPFGLEPNKTISHSMGNQIFNLSGPLACFLKDTLILTPDGEKKVQELKTGDTVVTYCPLQQKTVERRVSWVGSGRQKVETGAIMEDLAGYPVRIHANAIAEGVPHQDLLVTPEHCMFVEGRFIPVRMLVNHVSITYEKQTTAYDYYHIETEQHSVLFANGAMSESYLDTGNRASFAEAGSVILHPSAAKSWDKDAAAPLATNPDAVEALFRALEARCAALNLPVVPRDVVFVEESDLHLETENGFLIRPTRIQGDKYIFMLPKAVEKVYLVSRKCRPCDRIGAFVDDRRELGVCVGEVSLQEAGKTRSLTEHLIEDSLIGWHGESGQKDRWTNGGGALTLSPRAENSLALLSVQVVAAGPYMLRDESVQLSA